MRDGCMNCGCTVGSNTYSLLSVMEDCVIAAGPQWTYIIYTGVAGVPEIGENITTTLDVCAEAVIRLDTKR